MPAHNSVVGFTINFLQNFNPKYRQGRAIFSIITLVATMTTALVLTFRKHYGVVLNNGLESFNNCVITNNCLPIPCANISAYSDNSSMPASPVLQCWLDWNYGEGYIDLANGVLDFMIRTCQQGVSMCDAFHSTFHTPTASSDTSLCFPVSCSISPSNFERFLSVYGAILAPVLLLIILCCFLDYACPGNINKNPPALSSISKISVFATLSKASSLTSVLIEKENNVEATSPGPVSNSESCCS